MSRKTLLAAAAAALVAAPPAGADHGGPHLTPLYPETVPGGVLGAQSTIVRQVSGSGLVGAVRFRVSPTRVVYGSFRSVKIQRVLFGTNAVKVHGLGLVGDRRVVFTAVGVHNLRPGVDLFRISWNRGAVRGGVVTSGSLFIR